MSKSKPGKKKVVVSTSKKRRPTTSKIGKSRAADAPREQKELMFGRKNYLLMIGGVVLIIVGMILMVGGEMPAPDVWHEEIIYSTRRTTIAPIVILAGLIVEIYAIFKK